MSFDVKQAQALVRKIANSGRKLESLEVKYEEAKAEHDKLVAELNDLTNGRGGTGYGYGENPVDGSAENEVASAAEETDAF